MIYQSVSFYSFQQAFSRMGREDQFSYVGLNLLFDYLENLADDTDEPIELDVISICCDYTEYTLQEIVDVLGVEIDSEDQIEVNEIIDVIESEGYTVATYDSDSDVYILQG